MKHKKMLLGLVLTLAMLAALAVTAYAASVTVKYRVYVYSDEITFRQYDYSQSTTPSITNLTISATSGLGSGSALYHGKHRRCQMGRPQGWCAVPCDGNQISRRVHAAD